MKLMNKLKCALNQMILKVNATAKPGKIRNLIIESHI